MYKAINVLKNKANNTKHTLNTNTETVIKKYIPSFFCLHNHQLVSSRILKNCLNKTSTFVNKLSIKKPQ